MRPRVSALRCLLLLRKGARTKRQLADELGVSTRTVKRMLGAIEDAGWFVEIDDDHKGGAGGACERLYRAHDADVVVLRLVA